MRLQMGFSDSDLAAYAHETERRGGARRTPDAVHEVADRLLRSTPNPRDQALSSVAKAWVQQLPASLRPHRLCERYPRIANRLALCWGDPELTTRLFQSLLSDRRGTRRGYPVEIQRELNALRAAAAG